MGDCVMTHSPVFQPLLRRFVQAQEGGGEALYDGLEESLTADLYTCVYVCVRVCVCMHRRCNLADCTKL